ncbi:MAG: hypothetical protein ACKVH2_01495 [Flavobacteriales bacterium]|jgi:hypothetical protein|tara:strand:- start:89 stop:367 length:279 start_codon:yes stop_codon:yes gene_type:complete
MNNQTLSGFLVGLISPFVAFSVYVLFFLDLDLFDTLNKIVEANKLPHIISLSLLINLLIFFMKIKTNRDHAARGVLGSTILYGFLIVILKFI